MIGVNIFLRTNIVLCLNLVYAYLVVFLLGTAKLTRTYARTSSCFCRGMQDYKNLCVPRRVFVRECKTTGICAYLVVFP
jgi:hypothetical protein